MISSVRTKPTRSQESPGSDTIFGGGGHDHLVGDGTGTGNDYLQAMTERTAGDGGLGTVMLFSSLGNDNCTGSFARWMARIRATAISRPLMEL